MQDEAAFPVLQVFFAIAKGEPLKWLQQVFEGGIVPMLKEYNQCQ